VEWLKWHLPTKYEIMSSSPSAAIKQKKKKSILEMTNVHAQMTNQIGFHLQRVIIIMTNHLLRSGRLSNLSPGESNHSWVVFGDKNRTGV
jgi:hypothetical protein